jgi:HlyD family secretion protein
MLKRIIGVIIVAVLLTALLLYSQYRPEPLKVSGFIEADEIRLGSRVGGRVEQVFVEEGDNVEPGAVLVRLEPFDLREQRAKAQAEHAAAQARYEKYAAGLRSEEIAQAKARRDRTAARLEELINGPREEDIAAARARAELAEAKLKLARQQYDLTMGAAERGAASSIETDEVTSSLKVAESELLAARQELAKLEAGTRAELIVQARAELEEAEQAWQLARDGFRAEEIAEAKASAEAAAAALALIDRRLEELNIRAAVGGVVEAFELRPGDLVPPDAPVVSILDMSHLWVRAYVPEDRLSIEIGQMVEVTVDSFPDERFAGEITFISTQAEFTPRNVQTPEERSKQVFRIKVTLREGLDRLRPGMAADVWLDAGEHEVGDDP